MKSMCQIKTGWGRWAKRRMAALRVTVAGVAAAVAMSGGLVLATDGTWSIASGAEITTRPTGGREA